MDEVNYNHVLKIAKNVAANFIYDNDSINEIAQVTAIECYLNLDKIKSESLNSWIYVVARNKSLDHIKKFGKESKLLFNKGIQEIGEKEENKIELEHLLDNTPNIVVPIKHKKLLKKALIHQYDFDKLSKDFKMKKGTIRNKVYRIQQEILLYHKIQNGAKRSNPIPGTKLHHNIQNFLDRFHKMINSNDVSIFDIYKMNEYTKNKIYNIKIKKIIKYQFDYLGRNTYNLIIAFFNYNDKSDSIRFDIKMNKKNIEVFSSPKVTKKVIKIPKDQITKEVKELFKPGKDGKPKLPWNDLIKKLEELNVKVEIQYIKNVNKEY